MDGVTSLVVTGSFANRANGPVLIKMEQIPVHARGSANAWGHLPKINDCDRGAPSADTVAPVAARPSLRLQLYETLAAETTCDPAPSPDQ